MKTQCIAGGGGRLLALCVLIMAWAAVARGADLTSSTYAPGKPGLPNVLIIGDSISIGYTPGVIEALGDKANVYIIPENGSDTAHGLKKLDSWLNGKKWDVIHFQFGLHDLKYLDPQGQYDVKNGKQVASTEQYAKNLGELVRRLKLSGAKLIFATTTPVPEGSSGRIGGDDVQYNAAAIKVMKDAGVMVDDLGGLVKPKIGQYQLPRNVHFNAEGYRVLANQVAGEIAKALGTAPAKVLATPPAQPATATKKAAPAKKSAKVQ